MTRDILIGVDAGTSVIKAVAFALTGEQLGIASVTNRYETLPDGGVEQDMARTWTDTATTLRLLGESVPNLPTRTLALAVTGQGDGTWLIDKAGEPVAPGWLWLDSRAAQITEDFIASPAYRDHYQRTGTGVNACQQSVQLAWLQRNRPELIAKATSAHHCKDWLYFKLTGDRATDISEGNFTFGSYATRQYAPAILAHLGAPGCERLLPHMIDGTREAGSLVSSAAAETGLMPGTPVVLGAVDVLCSALGGGLYDASGTVGCTIIGSTGMHMRLATSPENVVLNSEGSGYTMPFPAPGVLAQMQSNMAGTLNIDWLLDVACEILADQGVTRSRRDLLAGIDERILSRPACRVIYHPYISRAGERGPFLDATARAQFTGLESGVGYADMMRAVFEGLCHAARDCYTVMGAIPSEVRLAGGAARSKALLMMLAGALGRPTRRIGREESGAAGAAIMAAIQQGIYPDAGAATAEWVDPLLGERTEPDAQIAEAFARSFPIYLETRKAMRPIWRAMQSADGVGNAT
jgi:erythritol kinase (D-erythritol 1-phosphate-forming)